LCLKVDHRDLTHIKCPKTNTCSVVRYFDYYLIIPIFIQPYYSKRLGEIFPLMWLNIGISREITKYYPRFTSTPQTGKTPYKVLRFYCENETERSCDLFRLSRLLSQVPCVSLRCHSTQPERWNTGAGIIYLENSQCSL